MSSNSTIPNLWPADVTIDVLPPAAFLRIQAAKLGEATKGLLRAEVKTVMTDSMAAHQLDLTSPLIEGEKRTILVAKHDRGKPYPVRVEADYYEPDEPDIDWSYPKVFSYPEFVELVSEVLKSPQTVAAVQSLLALQYEDGHEKGQHSHE